MLNGHFFKIVVEKACAAIRRTGFFAAFLTNTTWTGSNVRVQHINYNCHEVIRYLSIVSKAKAQLFECNFDVTQGFISGQHKMIEYQCPKYLISTRPAFEVL